MKKSNRQRPRVYIKRKLGRPHVSKIHTDHFDLNGIVTTVTNFANQAEKLGSAVNTTVQSVNNSIKTVGNTVNATVSNINAGYNNLASNQNPAVNGGYNVNTPNNAGVYPTLTLSANPNTNLLLMIGLGGIVLAVMYKIFFK